jgi:predicted metalloprotease
MSKRSTIQVQGEGYSVRLRPGQTAVIGTADDAQIRYHPGSAIRKRHAAVRWSDDHWELVDLDAKTSIYWNGQPVTRVELAQPETVRLGPSGPFVALSPMPRSAPGRWAWLLVPIVIVLVAGLVAGLFIARERSVDHRPFPIGACIATDPHWSAGARDVRPAGRRVNCEDRFDYKVLEVIPVPIPELTAFNTDKNLDKRALALSEGQCPPASWPALGAPDAHRITHEIYCVQDSIYTIDNAVEKENRNFRCVLRDGEDPLLVTPCDLRHDYIIREVEPLAPTAFPGDTEMRRIGQDGCAGTPRTVPFVASKRTWEQDYHQLLCLETDNLDYKQTIAWALGDLREYWDREFPEASPKPSSVTVLDEEKYDPSKPPRCSKQLLEDNAWHCPIDDHIAWDPQWFRSTFYDKYGDIAVAVVLAHEWGHVIQDRLGLNDQERWERLSPEAQKRDPVNQEHQADCYAGVWLRHFYDDGDNANADTVRPADTDRNKAVHALVDIADPYTSWGERFVESAHGDALRRMQHLLLGYEDGRSACQALLPA